MTADPLMVMMAPLVLLIALSTRIRNRGKELPKGVLVLVLIAGLGLGASACIPIPTPRPTRAPTPTMTPALTPSPIPSDTPTPSPTPEPIPVVITTTIDYAYDPLYRLTAADYDSSEFFHYAYDPVGNRLRQDTHTSTNIYAYDNPVIYTDASGWNPVLALAAGIAGGIVLGATAGGLFDALTYDWALSCECGCDMQQKALSMTYWD